jgi:hydrogenase/urease accessory protein HupE
MKLLLLSAFAIAAQAHEIGTTRVSAVFHHQRTYEIEVVTDATALDEKLAGEDFAQTFPRRVKVSFDGKEARPSISYYKKADGTAVIRLAGAVPPGTRNFTWTFGWTFATYVLETRNDASQPPVTQWLEGGDASAPFSLLWSARSDSFVQYLRLGFTHIVPNGIDHILFVLGIYFLSRRVKSVLLQVSAFTIAHSITLGLSLYGLVSVSPAVVEPLIALSIVYVAIENIFLSELKPWRIALVFAFGLLHGLGFAGALRELDLPRSEFATALVSFNVGVEAGQLAVIGAAFACLGWYASNREWYRMRVAVPASVLIACVALYWTVERAFY